MKPNDPYQIISKAYDILLAPVIGSLKKYIKTIYPPITGESVLDIGCGTGTYLATYWMDNCYATGIDLSRTMLQRARKKIGGKAHLCCENATSLSFSNGQFNLVIIILVIHEMSPKLRPLVLQECKRVCKQSGHILLADYHTGPYPFPLGWISKAYSLIMEFMAGRKHLANYHDFITHQGLLPLIIDQQLTIVRQVVTKDKVMAFYLLKK